MFVAAGGQGDDVFAASVMTWLRASPLTPMAAELVSPSLAAALGCEGGALLLRWGGNAAFTRAAMDDSASLGEAAPTAGSLWTRLASAEPADAMVFRVSTLPSQLPALWSRAVTFSESAGGWAHATAARGVVRCVVPSNRLTVAALGELARDVTVVGERLSPALWAHVARARSSDALLAGVKRAFDPDGVMNPGILGAP